MKKRIHHSNQETTPSSKKGNVKNAAAAATIGVGTVAGAYVGYKYGFIPDFLDTKITPQPTAISEVVDGMVAANEGLRAAAPVVALGALATSVYFAASGKLNKKSETLNQLSKIEYSGVDEINQSKYSNSTRLTGRAIDKISKFRKGTAVAVLAIGLVGVTSGLDDEISNDGPDRPVNTLFALADPTATENTIMLQGQENTFMDDSAIDKSELDNIVMVGDASHITIVPFNKELMNINGKSALQLSFPDTAFSQMTGIAIDKSCETVPVIVDDTVGAKVGESVNINGVDTQVVAVKDDLAQMNRSIAILSDTDMRECLKDGTDSSYFGAIIPNRNSASIDKFLADNNLHGNFAITSADDFRGNNHEFWHKNVTPIILILIGSIAVLGAAASVGERKSALERNAREIGMLNAAGVTIKDIRAIEDRRAFRDAGKALIIATPVVPALAAAFNVAELGLKVGVGPTELAVGGVVTLGAKLAGGRRAVKNFEKNLDLSQAVKG